MFVVGPVVDHVRIVIYQYFECISNKKTANNSELDILPDFLQALET